MPVVDARRHIQWAFVIRRNAELIPDKDGTARRNRAVLGDRVDGPNFVIVHELAIRIYRAVGESVRSRVKSAIFLQEDGALDPRAHSFTNRPVNTDGQFVDNHKVWTIHSVA